MVIKSENMEKREEWKFVLLYKLIQLSTVADEDEWSFRMFQESSLNVLLIEIAF